MYYSIKLTTDKERGHDGVVSCGRRGVNYYVIILGDLITLHIFDKDCNKLKDHFSIKYQ